MVNLLLAVPALTVSFECWLELEARESVIPVVSPRVVADEGFWFRDVFELFIIRFLMLILGGGGCDPSRSSLEA